LAGLFGWFSVAVRAGKDIWRCFGVIWAWFGLFWAVLEKISGARVSWIVWFELAEIEYSGVLG